jgi:hypothetical protein
MPASAALLNIAATEIASVVVFVGLVDGGGVELSGGGYARQACVMTATGANVRLTTDEVFTTEAGDTVAGWRGYSAVTGGTDYGGNAVGPESYTGPGTFTLVGASTGFNVTAV